MDQDRSWVIRTSQLKVGTKLSFDLTDQGGRVVLKAGQAFSEQVRDQLIVLGIDSVTIMEMPESLADSESIDLLGSYEPESVKRLQSHLANTQTELTGFVDALRSGNRVPADGIRSQLDLFFVDAVRDTSVALGVIAENLNRTIPDTTEHLSVRSARISWLAMITGIMMGMSASDTVAMGLAGALHDVSLLFHPEWFHAEFRSQKSKAFSGEYSRHPIESAELLAAASGLSDRLLLNVTQVHEQIDGSGYPRGLRAMQILPSARILNVVDAYLEIVDPLFRTKGVIPADALAQLCLHAAQGVFDRDVVQALIRATSLYPVGSLVELSDARRAVVIRSNPMHPMQPVVRILDAGHTIGRPQACEFGDPKPDQSFGRWTSTYHEEGVASPAVGRKQQMRLLMKKVTACWYRGGKTAINDFHRSTASAWIR